NIGPDKVEKRVYQALPKMGFDRPEDSLGKLVYSDPSLKFNEGTYVPKIMGLSGGVGGYADEYADDFKK
ncbi:MAG TPA: hypothetical protein VFM18_02085, partial [Methanosarcina sp.]|nr:hypothetical protein [Methanosarcina sp.]